MSLSHLPEPEPLPTVPPEQNAPVPPEEIDVTMVDSPAATQALPAANRAQPARAPAPAPFPSKQAGNGRAANVASASPAGPKRDPQSRLEALFDEGTLELLLPADDSGVLAGAGRIGDVPTVAFASDPRVQGGAMGIAGCQAIVTAYDHAVELGAPILGLWHSGGARILEGVESLHAVGMVFAAMTHASGKIPQISVVLGAAAGGAAYGPALTDLVILSDQGRIFVTGPDVVRSVTGEDVDMERLGGPEPHSRRSGVVHIVTATDGEALETARQLVMLLGHQVADGEGDVSDTDLERTAAGVTAPCLRRAPADRRPARRAWHRAAPALGAQHRHHPWPSRWSHRGGDREQPAPTRRLPGCDFSREGGQVRPDV